MRCDDFEALVYENRPQRLIDFIAMPDPETIVLLVQVAVTFFRVPASELRYAHDFPLITIQA